MRFFEIAIVLICGFILDLILGDPEIIPHPVVLIGRLIGFLERKLLVVDDRDETADGSQSSSEEESGRGEKRGELRRKGFFLALITVAISTLIPWLILLQAGRINFYLKLFLEIVFCWQILSARTLGREANMVYDKVEEGDLPGARKQIGRIVGRDTGSLDFKGIIKACIETVAESTSDGVIAPLMFMAVGGIPLGFMYKAINTLDSMVGYKNERYRYFGTASARLDDIANFIPARITALLMIISSMSLGLDWKRAFYIWKRDRLKHVSPNSGNPEAACAGALGLELGGDAWYFGVKNEKATLGDPVLEPEPEHIKKSIRLMYAASLLGLMVAMLISILLASLNLR